MPRLLLQIELQRFPDQCLSELIVLFRGDELESGSNAHHRVASQRSGTKSSAKASGARMGKQNEDVE